MIYLTLRRLALLHQPVSDNGSRALVLEELQPKVNALKSDAKFIYAVPQVVRIGPSNFMPERLPSEHALGTFDLGFPRKTTEQVCYVLEPL